MFTSQSTLTNNNQTSERNTKMESQLAVNRITDEVKKVYAEEYLRGLYFSYKKQDIADRAFYAICDKFGIKSELTAHERGLLGRVALDVLIDFKKPKVKKCNICGEIKPLAMFSKNRKSPDGLQYQCKECDRMYAQRRAQREQQAAQVTELFKNQQVTVEDISMTFTRNNMQVKYTNSEFLYSPTEGHQFNDADVEDLLVLRALAKSKVERFNGSN